MGKLIESDDYRKLLEKELEVAEGLRQVQTGIEVAIADLDAMPEGLKRCGGCENFTPHGNGVGFCKAWEMMRREDGYCEYGT